MLYELAFQGVDPILRQRSECRGVIFNVHGGRGNRDLRLLGGREKFAIMLDYQFGKGTSKSLPREGLEFFYSKRSDRLKKVTHQGELFATIRPNGAIALTLYSASILISSKAFLRNSVTIDNRVSSFVCEGKSVFCKFVVSTGSHVLAGGEVVVLNEGGHLLAVGKARIPGVYMREFNAGVAVKVRSAHG